MQTDFVSFYDVPLSLARGTWVYGIATDENVRPRHRLVFGSIQGIDLSKKAVSYGVEVVGTTGLTWIPEYMLTSDPTNLALIAVKWGFTANEIREFISEIENISWVKRLRDEQLAEKGVAK